MLGWNYDVYSGLWDKAGHKDEMREYFRSRKAFQSCPHLDEDEQVIKKSWDKWDCMKAISSMARCVTTHMTWFTHHIETTKPIKAILDSRPVVTPQQITSAHWISQHNLMPANPVVTFGALRTFIPRCLRSSISWSVRPLMEENMPS